MRTYSEKVLQIKVIRDYLVTILTGILSTGVKTTRESLLNDTDYPILGVIYQEGDNDLVRERGNAILTFWVVYRNRIENEMDELAVVSQISEKFEDCSLGGRCSGMTQHLPQLSRDTAGETELFEAAIKLEIEI